MMRTAGFLGAPATAVPLSGGVALARNPGDTERPGRVGSDGKGTPGTAGMTGGAKRRALRCPVRLDSDGDGMFSLGEMQRMQVPFPARETILTLKQLDVSAMAMVRQDDGDGIVVIPVIPREASAGADR